jgi:hypothetical protein
MTARKLRNQFGIKEPVRQLRSPDTPTATSCDQRQGRVGQDSEVSAFRCTSGFTSTRLRPRRSAVGSRKAGAYQQVGCRQHADFARSVWLRLSETPRNSRRIELHLHQWQILKR